MEIILDPPKIPDISKYDRRYLHMGGSPAQVFTDPEALALYERIKAQESDNGDEPCSAK